MTFISLSVIINRIWHKRHFSFINGHHQIQRSLRFLSVRLELHCSFNFENLSQKYCEPLRHIVVTKRWSIIIMVQFAFDAMAYDVHVSDSFYFVLCPLICVVASLLCAYGVWLQPTSWISLWRVLCAFFVIGYYFMGAFNNTKMKSNRLHRNIIFLLNILCFILLYLFVFAWGFLTEQYI